jgi:hypothetical protein
MHFQTHGLANHGPQFPKLARHQRKSDGSQGVVDLWHEGIEATVRPDLATKMAVPAVSMQRYFFETSSILILLNRL